ncbi:MAG: 16S rRNA (guanine(966)-N(2))-methyltransferase RsmD [Gammaproteobacteria bacterium]|nr:16S rRNA (guanine(966)-N(2))-methyltransferase RsmD [Gammaproteobacteria bacterium]
MAGNQNQLRIIGGIWRGRKLSFPDIDGLRPTPDRVRETVFNWLQPVIQGARCLDLYCGSGAFGFEASSRGAAEVVMVDNNREVTATLQEHSSLLKAQDMQIVQRDVSAFLQATEPSPFDIVFLDPPYGQNLLSACCEQLEKNGWLKSDATIYLEAEHEIDQASLPSSWILVKSKRAGQVNYHLARRETTTS